MKNIRWKLTYLWAISFACFPQTAHANAIMPYVVVPWGQMFLFPIVVLIESLILRGLLRDKFRTMLYQSFAANLVSTMIGTVLFVVTMPLAGNSLFKWWFKGGFSSQSIRNAFISFLFAIVLWTISWFSETAVLVRMRKANSWRTILFPCAAANFASYALLLTLAVWYGKAFTPVEAHVDTTRNSSNIEAFMKPDKNYPYN